MTVKEIFEKLNTNEYVIEHTTRESDGKSLILGYIAKKGENGEPIGGLDRYEFVFNEAADQEKFIELYANHLKKIIG